MKKPETTQAIICKRYYKDATHYVSAMVYELAELPQVFTADEIKAMQYGKLVKRSNPTAFEFETVYCHIEIAALKAGM